MGSLGITSLTRIIVKLIRLLNCFLSSELLSSSLGFLRGSLKGIWRTSLRRRWRLTEGRSWRDGWRGRECWSWSFYLKQELTALKFSVELESMSIGKTKNRVQLRSRSEVLSGELDLTWPSPDLVMDLSLTISKFHEWQINSARSESLACAGEGSCFYYRNVFNGIYNIMLLVCNLRNSI